MTRRDELLLAWSYWKWRRPVLAILLVLVLYLNADDIGPNVALPYFAAVAGVLPILLLAAFIHGRDIATASAARLAEEERLLDKARADVDHSMFQHALLGFGVAEQMPPEWAKKLDDLDALRTRIDAADDDLPIWEKGVQDFGKRWAALLGCAVEVAAVGEAAGLIPLAAPTPTLAPAVLSGAAVAALLALVAWTVTMQVNLATQPVVGADKDVDDENGDGDVGAASAREE